MKKTYPLNTEGKNRDRLLDAIKHDIRKYVARQRRVPLPEGVDYWDFDCKLGLSADSQQVVHFGSLIGQIDTLAKGGADAICVLMLPKNGVRNRQGQNAGQGNESELS
jgi:hypothetical protein